jgi:hypothetical protein
MLPPLPKTTPGYNALKYDYCWQTRPKVFRNAFNGKLGQWTRSSDNGNSEALRTASPTVKVNKEQLPDWSLSLNNSISPLSNPQNRDHKRNDQERFSSFNRGVE